MRNGLNRITRRDMMKLTGSGIAAASLPLTGRTAAGKTNPGIAVQLYSVREHCKKDFDGTLEQIAAAGITAVEFAGYHNYKDNAQALKKRMDSLGLKAAGTHIRAAQFTPENINQTIDYHKSIGCKFLIVPGDNRFWDPEKSKEYADIMNQTAEILKPLDMYCGHHNHTKEFQKPDDGKKTYWDLFAERTSSDVIIQQDVGWTTHAGLDPVELINRYPGRTRTAHFKPAAMSEDKSPILGLDSVKWREIIAACKATGGTEWFVIEQEKTLPGKTQMECTILSFEGLKKIIAG